MATLKSLLVLLVCLFQVYVEAEPEDLKKVSLDLLVNISKEQIKIRQGYIISKHDDAAIEMLIERITQTGNEFANNLTALVENTTISDAIDQAIVKGLKAIEYLLKSSSNVHQINEDSVLEFLYSVMRYGTYTTKDFGNVVLKYINKRGVTWSAFLEKFEGMDNNEMVENFQEFFAEAMVKHQEIQQQLIDSVDLE